MMQQALSYHGNYQNILQTNLKRKIIPTVFSIGNLGQLISEGFF